MSPWAGEWPSTEVWLSCRYLRITGDSRNISGNVPAHLPRVFPYGFLQRFTLRPMTGSGQSCGQWTFFCVVHGEQARWLTIYSWYLLSPQEPSVGKILPNPLSERTVSPTHPCSKRASNSSVSPLWLKITVERKTCRKRKGCTTVEEGGEIICKSRCEWQESHKKYCRKLNRTISWEWEQVRNVELPTDSQVPFPLLCRVLQRELLNTAKVRWEMRSVNKAEGTRGSY